MLKRRCREKTDEEERRAEEGAGEGVDISLELPVIFNELADAAPYFLTLLLLGSGKYG